MSRREQSESGDIDALVTHPNYTSDTHSKQKNRLKAIVDVLEKCGLITDVIALGETKFMVWGFRNKWYQNDFNYLRFF